MPRVANFLEATPVCWYLVNSRVVGLQCLDFLTAFRASRSNYTVPVTAFAHSWRLGVFPGPLRVVQRWRPYASFSRGVLVVWTLWVSQFLVDTLYSSHRRSLHMPAIFLMSRLEPTRRGANVVDPEFLLRYAKLYSILVFGKLYILVS